MKQKAIVSVKWTAMKTGIVALTGVALQIAKANFLSPAEFGYLAIIMLFIGLFKVMENFGISQAVIQRDYISDKETSSIFFFNTFLAISLGLVLFLSSALIADFFGFSELRYYLMITSFVVVIGGPAHLFRAIMEKELLFKQLSIIEVFSNIILFISVLVFLFEDYGLIGIIYSYFISTLCTTTSIVFYCLKHNLAKVSVYFSFNKLKPFVRFGLFVSGKELSTFIANRLDQVIIGYFLAPEVLGIYYFGKNLLEVLRNLITSSFAKVLFPVFSKLKKRKNESLNAYKKITNYMSFIAFPLFSGIAVTANLFVPLIFGEQWIDSVIVFQVFSIVLIIKVLSANISTSLLYAYNKPGIVLNIDLFANIIYISSLIFFASEGMIVILILYSLYAVYRALPQIYFANKLIGQKLSSYFNIIIPAILSTVIMLFGVFIYQFIVSGFFNQLTQLIGSVVIGIVVYVSLSLLFQKETVIQLKKLILKMR